MAGPESPERIYLDACVWIAWFDGDESVEPSVRRVIEWATTGQIVLMVSPLHLVEVLGKQPSDKRRSPLDMTVANSMFAMLTGPDVVLVEFDLTVGRIARDLRLRGIIKKTPDAIHLAHAIAGRGDVFFTLDRGDFPIGQTVDGVFVAEPYILGAEDLFSQSATDDDGV